MGLAKSPGQIGDNITCNLWPGVQWVPISPPSQPDVALEPAKNFFAHYLDNLWLFWASCILTFVSIFKLFEGRCSVVNNNERLFWGLWEVIMGWRSGTQQRFQIDCRHNQPHIRAWMMLSVNICDTKTSQCAQVWLPQLHIVTVMATNPHSCDKNNLCLRCWASNEFHLKP